MGNRLLLDRIHRQGSGYTAKHAGNFLMANDPWFRGVTMAYGPDGGVFVSDWNDLGECHDYDGSYRTSGRIYKITHGVTTGEDSGTCEAFRRGVGEAATAQERLVRKARSAFVAGTAWRRETGRRSPGRIAANLRNQF